MRLILARKILMDQTKIIDVKIAGKLSDRRSIAQTILITMGEVVVIAIWFSHPNT